MIFLDHASTSPMSEKALNVYTEAAKRYYGNTGSLHEYGFSAAKLTEAARMEAAQALDVLPEEIYFTNGGTEGNRRAILSLVLARPSEKKHIITSSVEHPSVLSVCRELEERGYEITYLPVDSTGLISISDLDHAIRQETALVTIQHVNSETGTIQTIEEIGARCRFSSIPFHSDAVQSLGKIPVNPSVMNVDSLTFSAHKVNGPKGAGAVYIRKGTPWKCPDPLTSPSHEKGFQPGTVNTPGIAAFCTALSQAVEQLDKTASHMYTLRRFFIKMLKNEIPDAVIEGHPKRHAPHITGFRIPGVEGQYVMLTLDRYGICVSTGSACQVAKQEASHVLSSLGKSDQEAREFVRISTGRNTTYKELSETVQHLKTLAKAFKKEA
ncbi:cysteine desulfurase [Alteribacter lacisalsi]|uniref:Cysteine desulfurase n=1 Tax=Alteribacter lacisalsi TaxID=2045244 RepID=A0A2W0HDB3_9BACI|nr:cysteine desulfurase family protein [Alteribacter lacisalsi]PYZ98886.1 cysteine desulfurase [Alteribacter lacisalsi]